MTNKNKKIKRLVKATDQGLPAQFELIPTLTHAVSGPWAAAEARENTFDVDESASTHDGRSRSELEHLISEQRRQVSDLEYRLEESHMRRRGLDEEIKVREEITADINREIREARKQLMAAANELESLNQKYLQMRAKFDVAETEARSLRSALEQQGRGTSEKDTRIAALEEAAASATRELVDLRNYVDQRKAAWLERDAEYAVLQAEMDQLRQKNRELKAVAAERVAADNKLDDPTSMPAFHASELERLRKDNERFESYANELRIKLQDQIAATQESTSMRQKLEANLEVASGMINELTAELEEERTNSRSIAELNESLRAEFERETRQIRSELGAARQQIAEQDTINQQLASDLIDNQGFRQALENHLGDIEKENARNSQQLEERLAKAQARIGEQEHKMRVKDGAIADLMQELADQSAKLNFTGELETALQKIDGYRSEQPVPPRKAERLTRQLIGSADGKDLRFPLFRNRLSIGRTKHNDIQLDLRFVSRRHAVIATDNEATRIIDWGSRNGVYVNKKRITEKILKSGDVITIGLTNLRYEERVKR